MTTALQERSLSMELMPSDRQRLAVVSFDAALTTAEVIQTLDKPVADFVRDTLGKHALQLHTTAMESTKAGDKAPVPYGIVWPNLVGAETVCVMSHARRQAGHALAKHQKDNNLRLIVKR